MERISLCALIIILINSMVGRDSNALPKVVCVFQIVGYFYREGANNLLGYCYLHHPTLPAALFLKWV